MPKADDQRAAQNSPPPPALTVRTFMFAFTAAPTRHEAIPLKLPGLVAIDIWMDVGIMMESRCVII